MGATHRAKFRRPADLDPLAPSHMASNLELSPMALN